MTAPDRPRPGILTGSMAAGGLALTAVVVLLPEASLAYRAPTLHVVLETAEGVIALVVAYLLYGRYRRTGRARALLVTYALLVVAVANLALQAVPQAIGGGDLTPWAPLAVRLLGVLLFTAAALTPASVGVGPGTARLGLFVAAAAVVLLGAVVAAYDEVLPSVIEQSSELDGSPLPIFGGPPLVLAAQVLSGLLYTIAAVAFTRHATRESDDLQRWIGAGCALAAVARVNYVLFPSLYSDYVYTGDLLRLGFYLCLLVGAMREVRSYWESLSYTAVLEDRRRLARDLHDGLTQELTYIWSQSRLLPVDDPVGQRINGAAARAIDEARTAIAALTRTTTGSFADVLRESVDGLAGRYGAQARVDAPDAVQLSPEQAEGVLRIVAEAYRNAVRHGAASFVEVTLTEAPLKLVVQDDGTGFTPPTSNTSGGGFGLTSMRERSESLGARFRVHWKVGVGTTVEVMWT